MCDNPEAEPERVFDVVLTARPAEHVKGDCHEEARFDACRFGSRSGIHRTGVEMSIPNIFQVDLSRISTNRLRCDLRASQGSRSGAATWKSNTRWGQALDTSARVLTAA
jgi:hypothetical protein